MPSVSTRIVHHLFLFVLFVTASACAATTTKPAAVRWQEPALHIRSFEGPFAIGKRVALELRPVKDPSGHALQFRWVEFRKSGSKIAGIVHMISPAGFQDKLVLQMRLLDPAGKPLTTSKIELVKKFKSTKTSAMQEDNAEFAFDPVIAMSATGFRLDANPAETRVYDVSDVLDTLQRSRQADTVAEAGAKVLAILKEKTKPDAEFPGSRDFWKDKWIIAYQTPENHARIETALEELRRPYQTQVMLEIRVLSCAPKDEDRLRRLVEPGKGKPTTGHVCTWLISDREVNEILDGTKKIPTSSITQSPRTLVTNGLDFDMLVEPAVTLWLPEVTEKGGLFRKQKMHEVTLPPGLVISGKPTVAKDRKSVHMDMEVRWSEYRTSPGADRVLTMARFDSQMDIPNGQTRVLPMPYLEYRLLGVERVAGKKDWRVVKQEARNGKSWKSGYVLVKPVIVVREEVKPGKKAGKPVKP